MKLSSAIDGFYLYFVTNGNSKSTADLYKIYLARLCEYWVDPEVNQLTEKQVMEFYAWIQTNYIPRRSSGSAEPLKQSSVMKVRNALVAFFRWAEAEKLTKKPLYTRFKSFKINDEEEVIPFTDDELCALLKVAEYTRVASPANRKSFAMKRRTAKRDVAIIYLLLDTGVRVSELCRLLIKDVNLKTGLVTINQFGTGRKTHGRAVYLGDSSKRAVWSYLASRGEPGPNEPLLVSERRGPMTRGAIKDLIYDLGDRAGVYDAHPHKFRHTFAIMYLRNGGDLLTLQKILGHATLEQVKKYARIANSDAEAAHRLASPADNLKR